MLLSRTVTVLTVLSSVCADTINKKFSNKHPVKINNFFIFVLLKFSQKCLTNRNAYGTPSKPTSRSVSIFPPKIMIFAGMSLITFFIGLSFILNGLLFTAPKKLICPQDLDETIRRQAKNRCGYCLNPQELLPYKLEIEHLHPKSLGGESTEENLWLACRECNAHKAAKTRAIDNLTGKTVKIFNPRKQKWREHFRFNEDNSQIIGKTPCGCATVESLQTNNFYQTTARSIWVEMNKFPPKNV